MLPFSEGGNKSVPTICSGQRSKLFYECVHTQTASTLGKVSLGVDEYMAFTNTAAKI
jgi:hypothetical protein